HVGSAPVARPVLRHAFILARSADRRDGHGHRGGRTSVQDGAATGRETVGMRFDTKIAIAVRADLAAWQKLNVTAFLASAVAGGRPEVIGERYQDASDNDYLPMFRQPVLVYGATAAELTAVHGRALARQLAVAVYIEEMFKTGNADDNRAAV